MKRSSWRLASVVSAAIVALSGLPAAEPQSPSPRSRDAATAPKLVVIIVVDQMRADYVDRFQPEWTGGLKRLVASGAWFRQAAYPYLTTVTCPGHATVATGVYPRVHGIMQNTWFDRDRGRITTCTDDPAAHNIGYATKVPGGDSAHRLMAPTLADVLRARGGRVVSLALKERSAIMLAGHGGDAVTWLSNELDEWVTSSAFSTGPVGAVKAFLDANPIDADYEKIWERLLPLARYREADDGLGEAPPAGWTTTFPHALNGTTGRPDNAFHRLWERSPYGDAYVGRFAAALVESMQLGRHESTDVLGVSFSTPDLVGHAFGPRSQEIHDVYARLDRTIGTLLERLDRGVGRDRYVVALTADHGVTPIPEQLKKEGRDAGRLTAAADLATFIDARAKALAGDFKYVSRVVGNDVYFERGMYERLQQSPDAMKGVVDAVLAREGIARVFRAEEVRDGAKATDPLLRAAALSYYPGPSGDLILIPKPGWMFSARGTTHATANADDQRVPILVMGAAVKPGTYWQPASPADVAPTLAALCGVTLPSTDGRVLSEAIAARRNRTTLDTASSGRSRP